jgi:hypothetical protein
MMLGRRAANGPGSRYLYEPFDSAHARIEANERIFEERWNALEHTLDHIEKSLDRLERRVWIAVYGVAAAMMAQFGLMVLGSGPFVIP